MVPNSMLPICTEALPRPPWETLLKYLIFGGFVVATAAAVIMGYVEASAIVSGTVLATVRVVPEDDGKCLLTELAHVCVLEPVALLRT